MFNTLGIEAIICIHPIIGEGKKEFLKKLCLKLKKGIFLDDLVL